MKIWETSEGEKIPISVMTESHINNALRMLRKIIEGKETLMEELMLRDQGTYRLEEEIEELEEKMRGLEEELEKRKNPNEKLFSYFK